MIKKPMKAAILSLLLPGGGQLYNEAYVKFGIIGVLEGGLIGLTLYHHFKGEDYYNKFLATEDEKYYDKYVDYYYQKQNDLWWLGVTIFLSTLDAYVDAHLYDFESEKKKIHLKFDGQTLGLEYRF
jgi:hypothetical protein